MTNVVVHPSAIVDEDVLLGEGTRVWHFVHVCRGARTGSGCVLGQNVYVGPGVVLGNRVKIQNNVSVYAGVEVADDVFLGPSCVFTNVANPRSFIERKDQFKVTRVGRGASIGANATIVCGHDVGEYAFIGAGSVVTRDVAPHALVYGNPARRRGWVCRCGTKLADVEEPRCPACNDVYRIEGDRCTRVAP